ncbi:integrase core domain-containing protein [Lysobacter korlensis]|uniref:Integrase core domain-containing protein n=1 Tax=Lysobacter korlensis TaxID=553636 RepID=A0ABV6RPX9_9GAMM
MTDNGARHASGRFRQLLNRLALRHLRTRPCTPRTNCKVERLVQTRLRESACARSSTSGKQSALALPRWLQHYKWHRPHPSLR